MLVLLIGLMGFSFKANGDWGFYAHRLINRMAVFTLPPSMLVLFKPHIDYLEVHAVDPDKRRYASNFEAVRHYIDLDHWGEAPYHQLPRNKTDAYMRHTDLLIIDSRGDSTLIDGALVYDHIDEWDTLQVIINNQPVLIYKDNYLPFFYTQVMSGYYQEEWMVSCDSFRHYLMDDSETDCLEIYVIDSLSQTGILPYYLVDMQRKLTNAFVQEDITLILRTAAEMGHYIGDAHVPLHTTENYNGQLTDQIGIHAFWESRIPELFAVETYDFFVGKATYIDDPESFYWEVVLKSNSYVDSLLQIEKSLSETYPSDQQYCFDERLNRTIRTQCAEYAKAYQDRMQGQVQARMQDAIRAIGSSWYTAWIDAGQPDFMADALMEIDTLAIQEGLLIGRKIRRGQKRTHE